MTRIDFYILESSAPDACTLFSCRLAEKAWKQGNRVYVNAASETQLRQLDDLMWTFRAGSFLPHRVYTGNNDTATPVLLGHAAEPEAIDDVLVNLAPEVPACFSRFQRVAELVGGDETHRNAGRNRYRYYQERGYPLQTHRL